MNLFWDLYWPALVAAAVARRPHRNGRIPAKARPWNIALAAGIAVMLVLTWHGTDWWNRRPLGQFGRRALGSFL